MSFSDIPLVQVSSFKLISVPTVVFKVKMKLKFKKENVDFILLHSTL